MSRYVPILLFLAVVLFLIIILMHPPHKGADTDLLNAAAPRLSAMPLEAGDTTPDLRRFSANDGPVLINFFASWCTPCLAEEPQLMDLKQRYGIAVIGIAWHDQADNARRWLKEHGNPYRFAGLDDHGETAVDYGATGVPESFVIDRQGRVVYRVAGPLTPEIVEDELLPILQESR